MPDDVQAVALGDLDGVVARVVVDEHDVVDDVVRNLVVRSSFRS
jgi:hypothetical protein